MDTLKFPCIYLKNGRAVAGFYDGVVSGDEEDGKDGEDPVAKAEALGSATDTQGLMIFDFSDEEEDHDASLREIAKISRATQLNIIAAGNVRTASDVKDYLSAGCSKVVLNMVKDSNREIFREVSRRFGRQRIGAYVPDYNEYLMIKDDIEACVGVLLADRDEDDDEKIIEETKIPVLIHDDQNGVCLEYHYRESDFQAEFGWKDFKLNSDGLIPCVVQDYKTDKVLMVAYMNEESFSRTLQTGRMTYWSRSRKELWMKGLTSGHFQYVKELRLDCDNDTLLAKVAQVGAACHTGHYSCFYRTIMKKEDEAVRPTHVLMNTYDDIREKIRNDNKDEENVPAAVRVKDTLEKLGTDETRLLCSVAGNQKGGAVEGIADLIMDCMNLMAEKNLTWEDVAEEISDRG